MSPILQIIIAPILTMAVVQSIKIATDGIKGNFNVKNILTTYGGMPSGHSSFVSSLSTIVAYQDGIDSSTFAISVIFSLLVITDAMLFRKHVDKLGKAVKKLANELPGDKQGYAQSLKTNLEHTLPQIIVGVIIGIVISSIVFRLF